MSMMTVAPVDLNTGEIIDTSVPAIVPDVDRAKLPMTYTAARKALAECSRIDECKDWADKAQALASYARQAKDETLRRLADRIQARASRRCGELLKQIPASAGGRPTQEGAHPSYSRTEAANDAGLSEHQRKTALRVASLPAERFEQLVEADSPPTVTQLAAIGARPRGMLAELLQSRGERPATSATPATPAQESSRSSNSSRGSMLRA